MEIQDFKAKHPRQKCFILANGPSLTSHDLLPALRFHHSIGMNRSWQVYPNPSYHLLAEQGHWRNDPFFFQDLSRRNRLFVIGNSAHQPWPGGIEIPLIPMDVPDPPAEPFSYSLGQGVVLGWAGQGSVAYAALQLAVFMGFNPIYFLGLDLSGPHFEGTPASPQMTRMNRLFQAGAASLALSRPHTKVFICGSPNSLCNTFPRISFEAAVQDD